MKPLIIAIFLGIFSSASFADRWCKWDGTQGTNCQDDNAGFIRRDDGFKVRSEGAANAAGYYRVVVTTPTVGPDQIVDAEVWSFAGNEIGYTQSVRDLTAQEIQDRDDILATRGVLSRELYYVLKWLIAEGVISSANIANAPAALRSAYQARGRLEN